MNRRMGLATALTLSMSCAASPPLPTPGTLYYSLTYILANPLAIPSEQSVSVQGFLSKPDRGNALLYLTEEHALARDTFSAVFVGDPTPGGTLSTSDCNNRFVSLTGTFRRRASGEISIDDVIKIEYWKPTDRRVGPWDEIVPTQCWPPTPAA